MPAPFNNDHFLELARKWPSAVLQYLHKHFYHKLVHISQQRTNHFQASQDIVQTVLMDVCQNIHKLAARPGFLVAPYLLMLVKFKSVTYFTTSIRTRNQPTEFFDEVVSPEPSVEDWLFELDDSAQLRSLVEKLPQRERECINLKYFEGLSNDMVADRLGIKKKTVEKHLTSGVRSLRKHFGVLS